MDWIFIGRVEYSLESLNIHWNSWCWSWNSNTLGTSCEELTHWKRPRCWEGLGARGEGDDRGWDGWMALLTWWTWVWVNSRIWWWTGRPGVLQFMGSQSQTRLSDWTKLNWIWNQSVVSCPVLIVASWHTYRVLSRQVRWSGISISLKLSTICCDPHSQKLWHSQ